MNDDFAIHEDAAPNELVFHEMALARLDRVVARVTPEQLALPTPCSEWDVRSLLRHLCFGNRMFTRAAGVEPPPDVDDPVADYLATAAAFRTTWDRPGTLERMVTLPWGDLQGAVAARMHFVDVLVHGWDLGVAIGWRRRLESALARHAYQEMTAHLGDDARGEGEPFAYEVPWPIVGDISDQLLAFLGRDPHWGIES